MAQPYINLYIGDLLKDTDCLSLESFGAFMKLLFKLHLSPEKGRVSYTKPQLARVFGCSEFGVERIIDELIELNIFDICVIEEKYLFISRRMIREVELSKIRKEAGGKGGKKTQQQNNFAKANGEAKAEQFTGIGNGNGNGNDDDTNKIDLISPNELFEALKPTAPVEPTTPAFEPKLPVKRMLDIWKDADPSYPTDIDRDFKPLYDIATFLAKQKNIELFRGTGLNGDAFLRIYEDWQALTPFIAGHKLFKQYSLQQMSKHIQSILQAFKQQNENDSAGIAEHWKQKYSGNNFTGKGASINTLQALKSTVNTNTQEAATPVGAESYSLTD